MSGPESSHALVLAAGRGTRMGSPKALMEVGGRAWWMIQRERVDAIGVPATWVVSPAVEEGILSASTAPLRLVRSDPAAPMFSSLLAGIASLRTSPPGSLFVLPVDCPAPSRPVWEALAASGEVAVPVHAGARGHPVHLPWSFVASVIEPAAVGAEASGPARLDLLIAPIARSVEVDDPDATTNLNTPADVQDWLHRRAGR